jgi:signal transduction histidine kinase
MLEEVDRLTRMVDTLLRLSRGDAGTARLAPESLDLAELARDVVSSLAILADDRRQRLEVEAASIVPVVADRLMLRDAVANVVDNAIKYAPAGSRIIVAVNGSAEHASLTVTDEGPGISPEHRARIFDRFYRVDEGRSREMGGTGLGLAIAKWAVEANGGHITLDSTETGSTFRLELPRPH